MSEPAEALEWWSVRCFFSHGDSLYEERITLWRARDFEHAVALAEEEASHYNEEILDSTAPTRYLEYAQAYRLFDDPHQQGAEVYSLMRDSDLAPADYLDRFFDTGDEHQGDL